MNLKSLNMKEFGLFQNRELQFGAGLNLIFGPNESGKTTLVDAIVLSLLSQPDRTGEKLKSSPRALKPIRDRYGPEVSLRMVAEHQGQEMVFPSVDDFQARWGVGWDELRAIFIAREGDLELAKSADFQKWWQSLKGKLLGFEEEPRTVLKKIAAEAGLTENLGLTMAQQRRVEAIEEKLRWHRESEDKIRSLRTLENARRDLQLEEKRLIQEMETARRGLQKAKLLHAKEVYQQMKASRVELDEKHGRYADKDLNEWIRLEGELKAEAGLLDRLGQQREQEEQKRKEKEAEASQLIKRVGTLSAKLSRAVDKEADLDEALRAQSKELAGAIPGWTPWVASGLAVLSLILGLITTPMLLIACVVLTGMALWLSHRLRRRAREGEQLQHQRETILRWAQEVTLEAASLQELKQKIVGLRREKDKLEGRLSQLQDQLPELTNSVMSLQKQLAAKKEAVEKIRGQLQELREKTGLSELEELRQRVDRKTDLKSDVEKKFHSELKVLLGPEENSWPMALDELKTLEGIQPVKDEKLLDKLNADLQACRDEQSARSKELGQLKVELASKFGAEKPEEIIWKIQDLGRELQELEILQRAGGRVRAVFGRLLQRSDSLLDEIIGGQTVSMPFEKITAGRYRAVSMEKLSLKVTDAQARVWDFQDLSTGTKDQLLTVLRLALAEKRLQAKGFLIFDDALVTSDRTRLREQMEMLGQLSQGGWQILFMTAQDEVRQEAERLTGMGVDVTFVNL